jgi:hypothetical protein
LTYAGDAKTPLKRGVVINAGGADLLDIVCSAGCPLATVSANAHFTAARLLSSQSRSMYYCHAVKELVSFAISPPGYLI